MEVTKEAIKTGIENYVDGELRPVLTGGKGLVLRIAIGVGMDAMINKYINNPALELIGIKTSENTYEINKLYEVAKNEVEKDGIVEIAGIKFDKTDVEKVYKYVINAAGGTV